MEGLTVAGDRGEIAVSDVSFAIREGEIVGVAGVAGNGQRELAEAISGMRDIDGGERPRRRQAAPRRRSARGDPRRRRPRSRGPARHRTRAEPERHEQRRASRRTAAARSRAGRSSRSGACARRRVGIIRRYDVKTPGPGTPVRNLSGGNLQKLVLGREFADDPLVLVVAQPTRGLDVGAIETVHAYLREAAAKGVAILLMSEDLDEIRALADRILVIYEGEIVGEFAGRSGVDRGDRAAHGRRSTTT